MASVVIYQNALCVSRNFSLLFFDSLDICITLRRKHSDFL